jgi:ribosomal protein L11 methylase PrmA
MLIAAQIFCKALLDKFERVIGIDWDEFAIAAARENATEKEDQHCWRRGNRTSSERRLLSRRG